MSMDYRDRVEDVQLILAGEFGVADREAVELILASRLPSRLPYPWLILDTNYYSLSIEGTWYRSLGEDVTPLPLWRLLRPRGGNLELQNTLRERDRPRTFIEPNYEMPVKVHRNFTMWPYLLQECLRVRINHPKRILADQRAELSLRAAIERVDDSRWRYGDNNASLPKSPDSLPYYAELLQRVTPALRCWEALYSNLCSLAARRAYLFNRDVDSTDWDAVARVMRDTVTPWNAEIVTAIGKRKADPLGSLRGKYTSPILTHLLKTLLTTGVLWNNAGYWGLRDWKGRGKDIVRLVEGVQFS